MTNKVVLRSVDEFMADFKPVYNPMYGMFLGKSRQHSLEAGKVNFKRIDTIGDIRAKHIGPKDTVIQQLAAKEGEKVFKKYFLANQFTLSNMQDSRGIEDVFAQVLDEHNKQYDELFLLGEGTSNSTMLNNSLYHSGDANYVLESTLEVDTDADPCIDLHTKVVAKAKDADEVDGRKVILFYGDDLLPIFDSVYASAPVPFKKVLAEVLGPNYSLAKLPSDITPSGDNGFIIANLDQVMLHYTELPKLKAQGVNEEKMYAWSNFMMGSTMLEVLAPGGIIRQILTVET